MNYKNSFIGKLPWWGQLLFWGAVAFALYRLGRWAWRKFKTRGQKLELSDNTTNIQNLQNQGVVPSFPFSQYATWANQLVQAFNGCGTSNHIWEDVFARLKNDLDVALLIDAYGVREFDECNFEFEFGDFKGTLAEAIVEELSSDERDELNGFLQSNNIQYRF